jgi:hypothetical protein
MKSRALVAAAAYVAIVFSVAFALGTVRTLVVTPRVGDVIAVLIETPLILIVSWRAAGWVVRRFSVPADLRSRLTMGFVAFVLLMTVETALGLGLFDRPLSQQLAAYGTLAGAIGLLAQIAFGIIPVLNARRG